jgi:hypothetical protein
MSAQTPQTDNKAYTPFEDDANPQVVNAEFARTLEAERDHYKALCEELREALEDAADALYNPFEPDNQSLAYKKVYAALKKAQKDI